MPVPIPADLLCDADRLVTRPEIAQRMAHVAADRQADLDSIGRLAAWDPAMTVRLLAEANSARWGQAGLVNSTGGAVIVLGERRVRELCAGLESVRNFAGIPAELATMDTFWLSAVHVAIAAQAVSKLGGRGRPNAVFVAGLLHDIGQLVMLMRATPGLRAALEQSQAASDARHIDAYEREHMPFDHAQVGAALAAAWRLPACLKACIAHHHRPERARHFRAEVAIVHVADSLAMLAMGESEDLQDAPAVSTEAWVRAGVDPVQAPGVIEDIRRRALELRAEFPS
jgi:HD-like signal output (HDOD) protein